MSRLITLGTDGSALNNPNGPAGWAWVIDKERWNGGSFPKASNQFAEMFAILRAVIEIPIELDIHIQTDSRFCVNMFGMNGRSGWAASWKRNGWKKPDGKAPANVKLVVAITEAMQARKGSIRLEWVKGHASNRLNNAADRVCTEASRRQLKGEPPMKGPGWKPLPLTREEQIANEVNARDLKDMKASESKRAPVVTNKIFYAAPVAKPSKANICSSCGGLINEVFECRCTD